MIKKKPQERTFNIQQEKIEKNCTEVLKDLVITNFFCNADTKRNEGRRTKKRRGDTRENKGEETEGRVGRWKWRKGRK